MQRRPVFSVFIFISHAFVPIELAACTSGKSTGTPTFATERCIVYRSTYAPIQTMLFQLNCRVSIRIAQNRCSMWTDQPAVREHHETKNTTKKTEDCWTARVLYQTRMGEHFSSTSPAAALLSCLQSVVKSREDATQWETRPCPNSFETRCCHQIQYEPRFFFKWFKYLILSVFYFE